MTSAAPPPARTPQSNAPSSTPTPLSGAVPAQLPGPPSASTTATHAPPTPAGASVPAQHAKGASESPVNGTMAQGGSAAASNSTTTNGTPGEHGRKPSMVINASGASGYTPNGGPVGNTGRPPISFGSMNAQGSPMGQASMPQHSQSSSLGAPPQNPRVISPAHSPSPIPQPPASGGRPPSSLQTQNNGVTFGSMGGEGDQARQTQMPLGPGIPSHERRTSSQSMHGNNFMPPTGRGRGFAQTPYGQAMPSPGMGYRQMSNSRPGPQSMPPGQFQQMPPGSPFGRGRNSPAVAHAQPNMQQQQQQQQPYMPGNQQMGYQGYPPMGPQQHQGQQQYGYGSYNPQQGYYPPYYPGYQSQSPGPGYPGPYGQPQGSMQQGFHPPSMSRSTSQASERPPSTSGQSQTPSMQAATPSMQPANSGPQAGSAFVRPKKGSAIKITDANGNPIDLGKKSTSPKPSAQPQTPVIVSTPNAPTPPPRAPSNQHNRAESKTSKSAEELKNAFQEQVKAARRKEEEAKAKELGGVTETPEPSKAPEVAVEDPVKDAVVKAEEAAAVDAGDKQGEKEIKAAAEESSKAPETGKDEPAEETEEERMERMIAEMEAAEKEEEEREKQFAEKKRKEKEEADKIKAANLDEDLKRQEREAEEREERLERERAAPKENQAEPEEASKAEFAKLSKPSLGPGASAPASGTETPASEDEPSSMGPPPPPATTRPAGAQKPKPAHLKLETNKRVEPAEPTPGMQALKSARFLEVKQELTYPDGFKSPNPALNTNATRKGRAYDKDFLLQFQNVFKEKPSIDWDQKVKDTLGPGDEPGSARPGSARTPSSNMGRSASGRPGAMPNFGGPMGTFGAGGNRQIPAGTTSEQRFQASNMGGARPGMPGAPMGRAPSNLGMGAPNAAMIRNNSMQNMGGPNSPRQPSSRGGRGNNSRRGGGDRTMSRKEEADMAAKMPLTAHMEVKTLEKSQTGWKATSLGQAPNATAFDPSGNMAPDMVQRKVKAALNKMTPEKFDKIAAQILEIAGQSKNETDGRTLRQVIQLTFEKACDEAHWAGMYARFCFQMLTNMSTDIRDETIKDKSGQPVVGGALFRKYLLNRCQEEFERGWQVNLPDKPEGEGEAALLSDEYYIAAAAKRRGLGLIQFIGQLYSLKMLTLRIMHECVLKLLNFEGDPDEAAVENLTTLLKAVGGTMEEDEQGRGFLNAYFERIDTALLKHEALGSRPRFMILDLIDLRKAGWKGKDNAKGPKTIQQIHAEAEAAQRAAEAERSRNPPRGGGRMGGRGGGDARNFSGHMPPPVDHNKTTVGIDDLRRLQARGTSSRATGSLGPGGNLGPGGSMLGARTGSRRGAGGIGPGSSGATTRTNTPPVDKKEEQSSSNAFGALAALDPTGEAAGAASESSARDRSKSPMPKEKTDESTA